MKKNEVEIVSRNEAILTSLAKKEAFRVDLKKQEIVPVRNMCIEELIIEDTINTVGVFYFIYKNE